MISGQYRDRISGKAAHDPLLATALAMETRDAQGVIDQAVWVSCDLATMRRKVQERMRELVKKELPDLDPRKVFISATHTHTAPGIVDTQEKDLHPYDFSRSWAYRVPANRKDVMRQSEYQEFLVKRIKDAVVKAWKTRKPGGLSFGVGHAVVAHNRRSVYADGTALMYGKTNDPKFSHIEGISDHSVDVVFFWRGQQLEGLAVNVYCPAQMNGGDEHLSADFWYDTRKLLREKYGADLFVLPLTGASGDQAPKGLRSKKGETAMRKQRDLSCRQEIARRICRAVDEVHELAKRNSRTKLVFEHRVADVPLPVWQVDEKRYAEACRTYEKLKDKLDQVDNKTYFAWRMARTMMDRYAYQKKDPHYVAELHLLRLGGLAVATDPFELFADYCFRIKARSPATQTMVVQLTSDAAAYLPTKRAALSGGYSARIDDGVVGPEGGDKLVEDTLQFLQAMWPRGKDVSWDQTIDDPKLPRALILGGEVDAADYKHFEYSSRVRRALAGKANIHAPGRFFLLKSLRDLDLLLGDGAWDLIYFTFSTHSRYPQTPPDYENKLEVLVGRLKPTGARLIWGTPTPWPYAKEVNAQIDSLNEVANRLMKKHGIPVNDVRHLVKSCWAKGDWRQGRQAAELVGDQVAKTILTALGQPAPKKQEPGHAKEKTLIWEDKFGRFKLGPGWRIHRGSAEIKDGRLAIKGPAEVIFDPRSVKRSFGRNLRVEYDAYSENPCDLSLLVNVVSYAQPARGMQIMASGYLFGFGCKNNTVNLLYATDNIVGKSAKCLVQPEKWHHVTAEKRDGQLRLLIDGQEAVTASCSRLFGGGGVGFYIWNSGLVDNLEVYSLPSEKPRGN